MLRFEGDFRIKMLYQFNKTDLLPEVDALIGQKIKEFSTHDLSAISNSELMNRVDSKFLLPINTIIDVLNAASLDYSVLMIDNVTIFQYNNIYFDTPDLGFYKQHHNRKLNRHKVRHRHYADVGTSFLEVKFKNNKGRTIKNRCLADIDPATALSENHDFLRDHGINMPHHLISSQACSYQRISLANDARKERLTFDLNINFASTLRHSKAEDNYNLTDFFMAELKQEKLNRQSPFYRLMRDMGIRSKGFSKYCMGQSLTNNKHIKSNRFKANLIRLKKGA